MKKRFFALLLWIVLAVTCGCTPATFYEEEIRERDFISAATEGFTAVTDSALMQLWKEDRGFTVEVSHGRDAVPKLRIYDFPSRVTAQETEILQITAKNAQGEEIVYGTATAMAEFFDPYRNQYRSAIQVYRKDNRFRLLLFFTRADDFYPFPAFLSPEMYQALCDELTEFTEEQAKVSDLDGYDGIDYVGLFQQCYAQTTDDPRLTQQNGRTVYRYVGSAFSEEEQAAVEREVLSSPPFTMQTLRQFYREYGYGDYAPDRVIVPVTLTVEEARVTIELNANECYFSPVAAENYRDFSFRFCPNLTGAYDFITVIQNEAE